MASKPTSKNQDDVIILPNGTAYLRGAKAAVTFVSDSKNMFLNPGERTIKLPENPETKGKRDMVPWGKDNDLPQQVIDKVYKTPVLTSGMLFNISLSYGQGIQPVRYEKDANGFRVPVPVYDNKDINEFFETNDINGYLLEQLTDLHFHFNLFPEIILSVDGKKIVSLNSKEAAFCRWETMNPKNGKIENCFYSAFFGTRTPKAEEVACTPVLDSDNPYKDLMIRTGQEQPIKGPKKDTGERRFIIPVNFPTPGRFYYQKPYWYSIIESGWYDFALKIPEFKNALLGNQMTVKYHIQLHDDYFKNLYKAEGITDSEKQKARMKQEYADMNAFLSNPKNTGKSVISFFKHTADGKNEMMRMKIDVIDDKFKGGEYLDDSEEVSNILSYGMGVHPSVIGSAPGKAKTINGTEARELFLIKQALIKPFRDRLLLPLNLIKRFNEWDENIFFDIPDIKLTTLDKNPNGTVKAIGETQTAKN